MSKNTTLSQRAQQLWINEGAQRLVLRPDKRPSGHAWVVCSPSDPYIDEGWGAIIPDGICVIDVDVKDGKPGLQEFERLCADIGHDITRDTLVVDSPSGGFHVYLRIPPGVRTGAIVRGYYGIDVKGPGNNYVCGPGTRARYTDKQGRQIDGTYRPRSNPEIGFANAPEALVELILPRERALGPDLIDDSDDNLERFRATCRDWYERHGPHQRYQLATLAGDMGLPEGAAVSVIEECLGRSDDTAYKVSNAYRYRQNRVGSDTPEALFEPVTAADVPGPAERRVTGLLIDAIGVRPRLPDWLVADYLERDTVALLIGAPGSYKSFLAIDWALSVAYGQPWSGCAVSPGPVLYLAGEGQGGMGRRLAAWHQHHGVEREPGRFFLSRRAVPLPAHVKDLLSAKDEVLPEAPALVVIDTLNRSLVGEENSATDLAAFFQCLDGLRDRWPGVTVLLVHHTGKDRQRGARGSSAILGAVDAEYVLERAEEQRLASVLTATKMKDAEQPMPMTLLACQVQLAAPEGASSLVLEKGAEFMPVADRRLEAFLMAASQGKGPREMARILGKENLANSDRKGVTTWLEEGRYVTHTGDRNSPWAVTPEGLRKLEEIQILG